MRKGRPFHITYLLSAPLKVCLCVASSCCFSYHGDMFAGLKTHCSLLTTCTAFFLMCGRGAIKSHYFQAIAIVTDREPSDYRSVYGCSVQITGHRCGLTQDSSHWVPFVSDWSLH